MLISGQKYTFLDTPESGKGSIPKRFKTSFFVTLTNFVSFLFTISYCDFGWTSVFFSKHNGVVGFSFSVGLFLAVVCAFLLPRLKPKELPRSRIGTGFH